MKYYKLIKNKNGKLTEIKRENIGFNIKPAKIYSTRSAYYGVGEASKKFLTIIEKVQSKMNKEIEKYWDNVANNWIEVIKQKEKRD